MRAHRAAWQTGVILASAGAAGAWLRFPTAGWAALVLILHGTAGFLLVKDRTWRARLLTALLLVLPVSVGYTQWRLGRIASAWPAERERRIERASARLQADLDAGVAGAREVAARAAELCAGDRTVAFDALARTLPRSGPDIAVAILEPSGAPWAWAGKHRLLPEAQGDSLGVRASPYYLLLERRDRCGAGRTAVASLLVWAHPVDPSRSASLVERFRAATGVGLTVYPSGTAPNDPDVFDYQVDSPTGTRTLFSVQPIPPGQGEARAATLASGEEIAGWLTLAILLLATMLADGALPRVICLVTAGGLAVLTPLGVAIGAAALFSPATFFRPILGPVSASAGAVAAAGFVASVAAVLVWMRGVPRHWSGVVVALVLLVGSPYLLSDLARGITPPSDGVPLSLWLTWEVALALAAAAPVLWAAALLRGGAPPARPPRTAWLGPLLAIAAAVVGLIVWNPRYGWPDWYTFLWIPALAFLLRPAPRWSVILGIGVVAGSAAGLVTWGAELEGRLVVATRDIGRLGDEPDPFAVPQLEQLASMVAAAPRPTSAAELYALWRASPIGGEDYPVQLALWSPAGAPHVELPLDSLDLPDSLIAAFVRNMDTTVTTEVASFARIPGIHYLLLDRLTDGSVLTAAVGPRTVLIPPDRLSRLLEPPARGAPLYELTLSYPDPRVRPDTTRLAWSRIGWEVHGERRIALPGGVRHVHARVDLRGPGPLLVRGTLVLFLDAAAIALLWLLAEWLSGSLRRPAQLGRLVRSFRVRLGVALALFFILPAAGFATLSIVRIGRDAGRSRDLLLLQSLRGAQPLAAALLDAPPEQASDALRDLGRQANVDVGLYEGGALVGVNAPVLADLGVLPALLSPTAYVDLALRDGSEKVESASGTARPLTLGYRVIRPGPPASVAIVAAPRLGDVATFGQEQLDLAYALLLAALLGIAAAVAGAGVAARALSRPVSDLRRAALALGEGAAVLPTTASPPAEFEPVFGAFTRMVADVRASQAALDAARRRTATVLRTVTTGVVAVDAEGVVLLANPRARELLGAPLVEGEAFDRGFPPTAAVLGDAVRRTAAGARQTFGLLEIEVGPRRLGLELADLGSDLAGVVVAITDLTDAAQAARVLAWGEMARQVAHEIKNPLTPIRLGVQHLRRVRRERPAEFDTTFDGTAGRILAEIDRLDTIARAFSRFAAPTGNPEPLERLDLRAVVAEVLELYRLAEEGAEVVLAGGPPVFVAARRDEVKETLVNLVENARNAGARRVTVRCEERALVVDDDGAGIPPDLLPRIFEPRFSTTTSGSGLGLSIVKRLVEEWGGSVEVTSRPGRGTTVTVRFAASAG